MFLDFSYLGHVMVVVMVFAAIASLSNSFWYLFLAGLSLLVCGGFGLNWLSEAWPSNPIGGIVLMMSFSAIVLGMLLTYVSTVASLKFPGKPEILVKGYVPPLTPDDWPQDQEHWRVYSFVAKRGPVISSEISRQLPIAAAALNPVIDDLFGRELLNRDKSGYTVNPWDTVGAISVPVESPNQGELSRAESSGDLTPVSPS